VDDRQTKDECLSMYWRMNQFCGLNQSPFSNGVTYDAFRKGFFVPCMI